MNHPYPVISFQELASTNTYAKENLGSLPEQCVITADCQTAGKGRLGRHWASPPGQALYLTFVLKRPQFDFSMLPLISAVAVCRALQPQTDELFQIKWPNDVLLHQKKICGILCESCIKGSETAVISGIGINLNQTAKDFSEESLPYATSLAIELGKNFSIPQTRDRLIQAFDDTLSLFIQRGFEPLREEYQAKLINTGKEVRVIYQKQEVVATAIGILENGNLLCQKDGKTFSVNSGEASVRGLYGYV